MAYVKITSYLDAIEKQMRADNLADHTSILEVVEAEHNEMIDTLKELRKHIAVAEAAVAEVNESAARQQLIHRIEMLEQKIEHRWPDK